MAIQKDFIIVGQGIAGSMLALQLWQMNLDFVVIDPDSANNASSTAAGLMNPITGRNFVKSWLVDDLWPIARQQYQYAEKLLHQKFIIDKPIIRALHTAADENQWYSRLENKTYTGYITENQTLPQYKKYLKNSFEFGLVGQSYSIHTTAFIKKMRHFLRQENKLLEAQLDYSQLQISDTGIEYAGYRAAYIIFAEGYGVRHNPYFTDLPMAPTKGEVLLCDIPNFPRSATVKFRKFFSPRPDGYFWVGSDYSAAFEDNLPSESTKKRMTKFLDDNLLSRYHVMGHSAGIRPTTRYRRPIVSRHPDIHNIAIFNGMGTKGYSLAPYWAKQLIDHIIHHKPLSAEVTRLS